MNSPVKLGVYSATSTLTGFLSRRFEAFFSLTGTLSCVVFLVPQFFLPVYQYRNVGLPGPPAVAVL